MPAFELVDEPEVKNSKKNNILTWVIILISMTCFSFAIWTMKCELWVQWMSQGFLILVTGFAFGDLWSSKE